MTHTPRDEETPTRYVLLKEEPPKPEYTWTVCCWRKHLTEGQYDRIVEIRDFIMGCVLCFFAVFLLFSLYRDDEMIMVRAKASNLTETFNVTQLAELVVTPVAISVRDEIERLKYRFVYATLHTGSKSDFVCVPLFYPISVRAISEFEEMILPHFQLSPTLSSVSELCFVKN